MSRTCLQATSLYQYADFLFQLLGVFKGINLKKDQLKKIQSYRFKQILYHAFDHSPFYRRLYREHGIERNDIQDLNLQDLPIIDKQIMMENFDEFVCDRLLQQKLLEAFIAAPSSHGKLYRGVYQVIHTSGSTGRVGLFVYDIHSWNITKALAMTRVSKSRINPLRKNRLAFIGATDHYAGVSLVSDAPRLFYKLLPMSINRPIEELISRLQMFQPTALSGYSSSVHLLAMEQLKGTLSIAPERIICSGDQLTDSMRETIIRAFKVNPVCFYASSESLCMAAECNLHSGLHLFEDWHIFELVNSHLQPVPDGEQGSLILTTLHNRAQPLIRYRMHDEMVFARQLCDCGTNYRSIERLWGRKDDFLWFDLPHGKKEFIHPSLIVEFFVPGLQKFQLIQVAPNHLHMKMVIEGNAATGQDKAKMKLEAILKEKKLHNLVKVSTEIVDDIALDKKTAKARLIVPYSRLRYGSSDSRASSSETLK